MPTTLHAHNTTRKRPAPYQVRGVYCLTLSISQKVTLTTLDQTTLIILSDTHNLSHAILNRMVDLIAMHTDRHEVRVRATVNV